MLSLAGFLALALAVPTPAPAPASAVPAQPAPAAVTGQQPALPVVQIPQPAPPPPARPPAPTVVYSNRFVRTSARTALNRPLTVALEGLQEWSTAAPENDLDDLRLYLAGRMLTASAPTLTNRQQDYVNFELKITPDDRALWVAVLAEARRARDYAIPLSVGSRKDRQPFTSKVYVTLIVYPSYTQAVIAGILALLAGTVALGKYSKLLRVPGTPAGGGFAPYSLGRVQMAWWFCISVAAYLYIWMITGEYNTLTTSVLALIGISAATGLAAVMVDSEKAGKAGTATAAPLASRGFVPDILSDADGLSFHRFQIVVWTIVLTVVFVRQVQTMLTMPEFDSGLLGLMGLSSGTYVGFKFPEKMKQAEARVGP